MIKFLVVVAIVCLPLTSQASECLDTFRGSQNMALAEIYSKGETYFSKCRFSCISRTKKFLLDDASVRATCTELNKACMGKEDEQMLDNNSIADGLTLRDLCHGL